MKQILETQRLILRELEPADRPALAAILQDAETMTFYEGAFSDEEVDAWLENNQRRYREDGCGLWAMLLKDTGEMVGQCGVTVQQIPDGAVYEVGYLLNRAHWHQGYALEAAGACRDWAFEVLGVDEVYSIIRDTNTASQAVAVRNGMCERGGFTKHYRGMEMPHVIYSIKKPPLG